MAKFRNWRPLYRVLTFLLLVVAMNLLSHMTSVTFVTVDPVKAKAESKLIEFASFQIRNREKNLSTVLPAHSTHIPTNPFPLEYSVILGNQGICKDSPDLDWIVYVHTSCKHFERRELLRKTWANPSLFKEFSFKIIFLMGRASDDVQQDVKKEFDEYGDIVQGDFVDDYKNLTLKAVMGLKWISTYCPHVPYAIKADDDAFLNIFEIVRLMKENRRKPSVIMCVVWENNTQPILRDPKTCMKWCVDSSEMPGKTFYPQYCAGIAYIISRQVVKQLYEASKSTPFFWVDDVYVTGLLPQKVPDKIDYVKLNERLSLEENKALESYKNQTQPLIYDIVHVHNRLNFIAFWNVLLDRLSDSHKFSLRQNISHYSI